MRCACKNLNEIFLMAIEKDISHWGAPGSSEILEMRADLLALAKDCGYEKNVEDDHWIQFPKQEKALKALGEQLGLPNKYEVIKEHDDGDLLIRIPERNVEAVVTIEGEIFTRPVR